MRLNPVIYFFIALFSRVYIKLNKKENYDVILLSNPDKVPYERAKKIGLELNKKGIRSKVIYFNFFKFMYFIALGKPKFFVNNKSIKDDMRKSFGSGFKHFKPKVIVQFRDAWFFSKYIKEHSSAKLVNIAHGVTGLSNNFKVIDYDYYFIYGESSLENLRKNQHLLPGSTKIIKTGPIFSEFEYEKKLKHSIFKKIQNYDKAIIYSSSYTKDKERQSIVESSHKIVIDYAIKNPENIILVSLHPLEKTKNFWKKYKNIKNIIIIESNISKNNIAKNCTIHLTMQSNSMIDFALRGLNTIIVREFNYNEEYLSPSKYFTIAKNSKELKEAINQNKPNQSKLDSFLKYHCEFTDLKSIERVVSITNKIYNNQHVDTINFKVD